MAEPNTGGVSPGSRAVLYAGRTVIALEPDHFAAIRRAVALLFELAHSAPYQREVDRGAGEIERFAPGKFGVFMGYDFHVTPAGPRLIEINTNAGGALLNGLHTAALCDPAKLACLCADLLPVEAVADCIVRSFASEVVAARGPGAELRSLAILDERPREQFLHPEFELFVELFRRGGIRAEIRDTSEFAPGVDLVYLRDTDFLLALFSSPDALARLGLQKDDAEFLAGRAPERRSFESHQNTGATTS